MKRVLVTGTSGFLGSHIVRHLLVNTDWEIVAMFRTPLFPDRLMLATEEISDAFQRIKFVPHDLSKPITKVVSEQIGRVNYIINAASHSNVGESIQDPVGSITSNVDIICNMLEWARHQEIQKFVQVSTDEVYGPAPKGGSHKEWESPYFPSTPYSAGKASQEAICFAYWRNYNVPIIIVNTMNLIGETAPKDKFFVKIINNILSGNRIQIHSSPDVPANGRVYIHARNQADAILHVLSLPVPLYGETPHTAKYHVVGGREISNLEFVQIIANAMEMPYYYDLIDSNTVRPGYSGRYSLDGSKLASTGWVPPVSFEESIKKTIIWTLNNKEWL